MIDWGNTPAGTVASLYWPQVDAGEVLRLADRFYTASRLSQSDAQVSGRVSGMGGNPAAIRPSPLGAPGAAGGQPAARREFTGKVSGIEFGRFGDFTGFRLLTESGADMPFRATEETIERLIRDAWTHRWVITVIVETDGDIERPAAFILRRPGHG